MKVITLFCCTFVVVLFSPYSQSQEGKVNVSSLFTNLGYGKMYSPISTGRSSSYLEESDTSQLGSFSSSLSYPSSLSTTQFRHYYGKSPSVKIESLPHSPVGMAVTMPITAAPWFYDSNGNIYGKNQLYPYYDNFDDHSYFNSGKGGHVKSTATVSAIASVVSLLSCLALAIPLLLIPLALALGAFLSLALILAVPVPVVTVNGGNGRVGNQKNPTTKKETRAIKDAFDDLMTKLPKS